MGLMAILHLALPKERRKIGANSRIPNLLLAWTLFSGIVGNIFFFHRPGIALLGGGIMGLLLAPYLFALTVGKPDHS
jgi:putative membrane protein